LTGQKKFPIALTTPPEIAYSGKKCNKVFFYGIQARQRVEFQRAGGPGMFQGSSALLLDAKGRMTVPSRHRDALAIQCEGRLTLTRSPDGCLLLFPRPVWEVHRERIAALPMNARAWTRIFLGSACDVDMDTTGRILIAPELRQAARLDKDVMLLGMGSHFEVWDAPTLVERDQQAIAAGLPDALSNFSF
jgi:MraZ protein